MDFIKERKKLKELKQEIIKIYETPKESIIDEIKQKRSSTYQAELNSIVASVDTIEEAEEFLEGGSLPSIDDLVVSEDDIYDNILRDKASDLYAERNDIINDVFNKMNHKVKIDDTDFFDLKFRNGHFISLDHDTVLKHVLKRENMQRGYPFIRKETETYEKQRDILSKLLSTETNAKTIEQLNTFNFIDDTLSDTIKRMDFALKSETDNQLYVGEAINHALGWMKERANEPKDEKKEKKKQTQSKTRRIK